MAKIDVFDIQKKKVGDIELADAVFGVTVNESLFYEVIKNQRNIKDRQLSFERAAEVNFNTAGVS